MSWTAFITKGFIIGIIIFIIFLIVGGSGGFSALTGVGKLLAQIPAWGYIVVALIILINSMFGGHSAP